MTGTDGVQSAPVRVDEFGGAVWTCAAAPAVTAVAVDLTDAVSVIVDAATPERVLAWTLAPGTDARVLEEMFADRTVTEMIIAAVAVRTDEVWVPAPQLTPRWARIAEVAAVARVLPTGVEEAALELDEAMARYAAGQVETAARLFTAAYPTLLVVADRATNGMFDDYTTERVRQVLHTASRVGLDEHLAATLIPMREQLDADHDARQRHTDELLAQWLEQLTSDQLIGATDLAASAAADIDTGTAKVDLEVVTVRVLQWAGPDKDEVSYRFDRNTDHLEITVPLAGGIDPHSSAVEKLMVYVADATSGRVVVCLPTRVRDGHLHAAFKLPAWDPIRHVVGVFDSDNPIRDLQADELGRNLIHVRRLMVESWRMTRLASEALAHVQLSISPALIEKGQTQHKMLTRSARRFASAATAILHSLIADTRIDNTIRHQLSLQVETIDRYRKQLDPKNPQPVTEPLLAEIVKEQP